MSAHTPCGPSSLERRALCPGSLSQELALGSIEEQSTEEAESGTQCHKAMEAYLTGADLPPLTDEENAKFKKALDSLESILQGDTLDPVTMTTRSGGKVHIELRMENLPYWHGEVGTVDFVIDYLDHILMLDWKFGGGFVPSPKWNRQFKAYALGCWDRFGRKPIHVAAVQPEMGDQYDMVPWVYEPEEYGIILNELHGIVDRCHSEPELLCVGKACQYCSAAENLSCPRYVEAMGLFVSPVDSLILDLPALTPMDRSRLLTAAKAAKKGAEALVQAVRALIRETGEELPGYTAAPMPNGAVRVAPRAVLPSWPQDASPTDYSGPDAGWKSELGVTE